MIGWLSAVLPWELLPLLSLGPLGIALVLLRHFSQLSARVLLTLGAVGAIVAFLWAYSRLGDRIDFLEADNETLRNAVETQEDTIDDLQSIIVNWRRRYDALQAVLQEQERIANDAERRLERTRLELEQDDLDGRARTEPGAVEDLLNSRTRDAMCRLRAASGAAPGDDCR